MWTWLLTLFGRVKDWLYGVRAAQPDRETRDASTAQDLKEAERYRIVYHLITSPKEEGGAGIIPKEGQWKNVESIFPLHDKAFNKDWIMKWSTMTFLKVEDLDDIRDHLGEKVSFCSNLDVEVLANIIRDRLLFRLYTVIFYLPDIPRCFWVLIVGFAGPLLANLRYSQWSLVSDFYRILEAPRSGSWRSMGCQRCLDHPGEEKGISARERDHRPSNRRNRTGIPCYQEIE